MDPTAKVSTEQLDLTTTRAPQQDINMNTYTDLRAIVATNTPVRVRVKILLTQLMVLVPGIYTLLHMALSQFTSEPWNATFYMAFTFILITASVADYSHAALKACGRELQDCKEELETARDTLEMLSENSDLAKEHSDLAKETLQIYKSRWAKSKKQSGQATHKLLAANKELLELKIKHSQTQDDLIAALQQRIDDSKALRVSMNETRLSYHQSLHEYQTSLIDTLDKLVRKFKNVPVPKVKGVSPKRSHSNTLTGPLERLATGLRQSQGVTEKQVAIAEKIKEVLGMDGLDPEEVDTLIRQAEDDLGKASDVALQLSAIDGAVSASEVGDVANGGLELRLDAHFDRLDAYFGGIAKSSDVEHVGEEEGMESLLATRRERL